MPDEATQPRWLLIVRRDRPVLYQHLREQYEGDGRVEVIFDRRVLATAQRAEGDRRQKDRRASDGRRPEAESGRRRGQRRLAPRRAAAAILGDGDGFFLTRRVVDTSSP